MVRVVIAEPALVLDDAEPGPGDRSLALGQVEPLDPLDRVRVDRRAQALPDDLVEVDEDAGPEDPVDLVLARRVAGHQPAQGGLLVGA